MEIRQIGDNEGGATFGGFAVLREGISLAARGGWCCDPHCGFNLAEMTEFHL